LSVSRRDILQFRQKNPITLEATLLARTLPGQLRTGVGYFSTSKLMRDFQGRLTDASIVDPALPYWPVNNLCLFKPAWREACLNLGEERIRNHQGGTE
jgi:hypothetical protein